MTVGVLQTIPFIERRPRLHNLELTAPQSELQRFELASGYSNDQWSLLRVLESVDHGFIDGGWPYELGLVRLA